MPTASKPADLHKYDFGITCLDLSRLVGFRIKVYSEQFRGRELSTKIVAASGRRLTAESGNRHEAIDNLVNHQRVILQFSYRGQEVSVKAMLQKTGGGRCCFELEDAVTPLSHRRFYRVNLESKVNLAPFPSTGVLSHKLGKLRWMETTASNFSAGGVLVSVPTLLHDSVRLLVNVQQKHFSFPSLVLVKVRHSYQADEIQCRAGMEFVTREVARRMFSPFQMTDMPQVLLSYTNARRETLNRVIREWDSTINSKPNTGVDDESE